MQENELKQYGIISINNIDLIPKATWTEERKKRINFTRKKQEKIISTCFHCKKEKEMKGFIGISRILCKSCYFAYLAYNSPSAQKRDYLGNSFYRRLLNNQHWIKKRKKILKRRHQNIGGQLSQLKHFD
jgi:hypothetical protein